ncbi:MAG: hypothetical protein OEX19_16030 [Gammaproteobacteria bacterium]|nr:hypothetical protein [Gammaproteobacteria bacterium]
MSNTMTPEQFCYWLQGTMEIMNPESLNAKQIQIIKDHLQLVFNKVTPDRGKIFRDPTEYELPNITCTDPKLIC